MSTSSNVQWNDATHKFRLLSAVLFHSNGHAVKDMHSPMHNADDDDDDNDGGAAIH